MVRQAQSKAPLPAVPSKEGFELFGIPHNAKHTWLNEVVCVHPWALWIDRCEGPRIETFEIDLNLNQDAVPKAARPIPFGNFDRRRVDFRIEEEAVLGKRVYFFRKFNILSSCLEGLGIFVMSSKCFHSI